MLSKADSIMKKTAGQKSVPQLRFPGFDGEWSLKKLGDEGKFLSSLMGKKGDDFGVGGAKFITYMNVFANTFVNTSDLRAVRVDEGESQNPVKKGDLLFTISSETPEDAGMSSVLLDDVANCYVNSFCAIFRFDEGRSPDPIFTGYFLRRPAGRAYFSAKAQGSTRFNLSKAAFQSVPLLVPRVGEQKKIADCLSSLDACISTECCKLESLKVHKQGMMYQLFPAEGQRLPSLRFPEFQGAPDWGVRPLGELVDLLSGYPFDGSEIVVDNTGERLMRGINITEGAIRHNDEIDRYYQGAIGRLEKYRLDHGDLVIGMDGSKVGKNSALITKNDAGALLVQRVARLRATSLAKINFIFHQIHAPRFHAYVDRINTSSGIPHVSARQIKEYPIHSTGEPEERRIADCLSSLDAQIAAQSKKIAALKMHKQGLMQGLFPELQAP